MKKNNYDGISILQRIFVEHSIKFGLAKSKTVTEWLMLDIESIKKYSNEFPNAKIAAEIKESPLASSIEEDE